MSLSEKKKIYKDVAAKNKKKSYDSWLLSEGGLGEADMTDTLASLRADKKLSLTSYGALGSELREMGLDRSGYADYLRTENEISRKKQRYAALHEKYLDDYSDRIGYESYVNDYNERQRSIGAEATKLIEQKRIFDMEKAYAVAMDAGLSEENALAIAASAIKSSKHKARDHVIGYTAKNKMTAKEIRAYAESIGLDERSITYILEHAKIAEENSEQTFPGEREFFASLTPEQYFKYLRSKYKNEEGK